ncbi:MAG: DUF4352 domain-containing protein [Aridibacter sp.]
MGLLLMLMTIGGLGLAFVVFVVSLISKRFWLIKFVVGGVFVWFLIYGILLIGTSLSSEEKTLAMNEPKEFCGFYLDCHLHTAVTDVRTAERIGGEKAQGIFYIVKVKVFSNAKQATLHLTEPLAELYDIGGRIYSRRLKAEKQLPTANVSLTQDVSADESFEKEIVFDVTEPSENNKLLITEGYGIDKVIEAFLIGDEDSIFHKRTFFDVKSGEQIIDLK